MPLPDGSKVFETSRLACRAACCLVLHMMYLAWVGTMAETPLTRALGAFQHSLNVLCVA